MSATAVFLHLLGDVALLLWGLHMVHSGVVRTCGGELRRILDHGLAGPLRAVLAGIGVTALLQSSTATALMLNSFTAGGLVALPSALAAMLGANIGTALVVQVLSFDLSLAVPLLVLAGVVAFRKARGRLHEIGRVAIGLGLMLLSLQLLGATVQQVAGSGSFREIAAIGTRDPVVAALVAAVLAWAAHSSIAAVVVVMSLAGSGILSAEATLAMVAGANLGSAFNPLVDALGDPARMRVPLGNLANRLVGAILVVAFAGPLADWLSAFVADPRRLAADGHVLFNLALAVAFLPLLRPMAWLLARLVADPAAGDDPARPVYLDDAALATPAVALSNAARETLRMADVVETMLRNAGRAFHANDRTLVKEVRRADDIVDALHRAIGRYLARLDGRALAPADSRRVSEILAFAINLEHIGDIIDRNLMELAAKRIRLALALPAETRETIGDMQARLVEHLKLAVSVFMFGDDTAAHRLVAAKDAFRDVERAALRRYYRRVRDGGPEGIETCVVELDILRDLKRIEAHIAATAYPLLEQSGALLPTRLAR